MLDSLKEQRSKILDEGVQRCQNYNCIEDLMSVNSSQAEKGTMFEKHIKIFRDIYAPLSELEAKRAEVQQSITANIGAFSAVVSATQSDQGKQQFYQQLDQALSYYGELMNMLHQGSQFYT